MEPLDTLYQIITNPKRTLITMHKRPDGDAIGSALALAELCQSYGHQVTLISPSVYPKCFRWMPGIEKIHVAEKASPELVATAVAKAECIFCVDFGEYHRLGSIASPIEKANAFKIVLDHHPTKAPIGDLIFCDPNMPATAQLLYKLIIAMGMGPRINTPIAINLYTAILTDTGSFMNSNTNAETHEIVAQLIPKGVDISYISHQLQIKYTVNHLRFMANAITHRLVVAQEHGFAFFAIPRQEVKKFNLQTGESGGLIRYALGLKNITIAALIMEQKEAIHLSFRSFGDWPVNLFAAAHFQGGGHKNAAGGISYLPFPDTITKLHHLLMAATSTSAPKDL